MGDNKNLGEKSKMMPEAIRIVVLAAALSSFNFSYAQTKTSPEEKRGIFSE